MEEEINVGDRVKVVRLVDDLAHPKYVGKVGIVTNKNGVDHFMLDDYPDFVVSFPDGLGIFWREELSVVDDMNEDETVVQRARDGGRVDGIVQGG